MRNRSLFLTTGLVLLAAGVAKADPETGDAFYPDRAALSATREWRRVTHLGPVRLHGKAGLAVVRVLEAAQESIRKEGERIALEPAP